MIGLNLDKPELTIPDKLQVFDTYFPKWVALSSAIDTAGLLIRIDRIVKESNLLSLQPSSNNHGQSTPANAPPPEQFNSLYL